MRSKKTKNRAFISWLRSTPVLVVISIVALIGAFVISPIVRADSYQQQIDDLNSENSQDQNSVDSLESQAGSYQSQISALQSQISALQSQISNNQNEQTSIQTQVTQNQQELTQQKKVLADDIRTMYVDGQLTPVEMLATSGNISQYVDRQESYDVVQQKIQGTVKQISELQQKLQTQKQQIAALLKSENTQNAELSSAQQQQNQLLSYNVSQQDQYNSQIQGNVSKIAQLQAELAAQQRADSGSVSYNVGTGSYPWADAPCLDGPNAGATCGDYDWGYPSPPVPLGAPVGPYDPWGYEYRNCTSYVAWKIASISTSPIIDSVISGLGNAAQWPGNVPSSWVSSTPQANDAAVDPDVADGQGHVMFVTGVNSNGTINVSQYNVVPGEYSTASDMSTAGLIFIHFPGT